MSQSSSREIGINTIQIPFKSEVVDIFLRYAMSEALRPAHPPLELTCETLRLSILYECVNLTAILSERIHDELDLYACGEKRDKTANKIIGLAHEVGDYSLFTTALHSISTMGLERLRQCPSSVDSFCGSFRLQWQVEVLRYLFLPRRHGHRDCCPPESQDDDTDHQ